ncbi:MAG: SDR family oxidoreductase [Candidatus Lokiarchaeota archaeon]|nr:SDR family oxidoreductase [Candidatus Lokiarchaeota archaeon]
MDLPFIVDLKNKVAVVTGGGGTLCGRFSEALAKCGAKVAVLDLNEESAQDVANRISKNGGTALAIKANVLEPESLYKAEEIILENFGSSNILINGAGGKNPSGTTSNEFLSLDDMVKKQDNQNTFFDLDIEVIKSVFNLNFIGTLLSSQVFAKKMTELKNSVIINISSMNSFRPLTKIPAYSAAKAAVSNFTQWLSVYLSKVGIRVNAIAPGFFLTEQNRTLLTNQDGTFNSRAKKILDHTPMGRFGQPDDLIGTLLWLIDEKASGFVNGIVIPIDGGFSAYSGV